LSAAGKVAINQEAAPQCARLKEVDEIHPKGYPHTQGWLEKKSWRETGLQLGFQSKSDQLG